MIPALAGHRVLESELEQRVEEVEAEYLVVGEGQFAAEPVNIIRKLRKNPGIKEIFSIGSAYYQGIIDYKELTRNPLKKNLNQLKNALDSIHPSDTSVILFTSGTTGKAKAVMTSHLSRVNSGYFQARDMKAVKEDIFCVVLPMFHCFGLSANIMAAMSIGACLHFPENRRSLSILKSIQSFKCTILNGVPTIFHSLISNEDLKNYDLSSLKVGLIGGAGCNEKLFRKTETILGCTLLSSLGMTESTAGITITSFEDSVMTRATTVGHFMDRVEGKIIDPSTENILPVGEAGEICVRGWVTMQGYYGRQDLTSKVIDETGWLHTGDKGFIDNAGNVHVTGRLKELIIKGGENICPAEIENVLLKDEKVADVKVIGVPDLHYGEELFAFVVPHNSESLNVDELVELLKKHLIPFKIPKYIEVTDALPRNENGKILVCSLQKIAREALEKEDSL